MIDLELVVSLYKQSLQKLQVKRILSKMKMQTLSSKVSHFIEYQKAMVTDEQLPQVESALQNYGLIFYPISKDGNCFFKAVATNIIYDTNSWRELLLKVNIPIDQAAQRDIEVLATSLRNLFVKEIMGEHRKIYESFTSLSAVDYEIESMKFLQSGFFANDIGDIMPLATATALQISLIIITTSNSPVMFVNPAVGNGELSAFVVYYCNGPGHYDAAIPYAHTLRQQPLLISTSSKITSCNCGVNKTVSGISCSPNSMYATRCKCYNSSQQCSKSCRCKNCNNPYGKNDSSTKSKRKRRPHTMQVSLPVGKKFAIQRGESLSNTIWSDFETLVLEEILHLSHEDSSTDIDIVKLYNDIVEYSKCTFCTITLPEGTIFRDKSLNQINAKITHIHIQCP